MNKYYAGIGSRQTPEHYLPIMTKIAKGLELEGWTLRSGGATGADTAFEEGATKKEIYLPWKGFNKNESNLYHIPDKAFDIAAEYHPRWHKLNQGVRKLMARNVLQILGPNLKTPSSFVVCFTHLGLGQGGTGQALRIARYYGIPVYDLGIIPYDQLSMRVNEDLDKLIKGVVN